MNIELYNDTYFSEKIQHTFTSKSHDKYSAFIDAIAYKLHKITPTITPAAELFHELNNHIYTIEYIEATTLKPHSTHTINFNDTLHNKLFFIQYTPDGTDGTQSKSTSLLQNKLIQTIFKTTNYGVFS